MCKRREITKKWTVFRALRRAMPKKCTCRVGFNGSARRIVAQCHSDEILLQRQRLVAVVVPSQCGFRPQPMRGGCRRRCLVPNRLSLMNLYYDTRFVLFCSTQPHESARCPDVPLPTRRVSAVAQRLSLLPPSAGLLGVPVVPWQLFSLRKNSVIEIIRSPSLLVLERVVLAHQRLRVPAGMLRFTVSWRRASFTTSFLRFTRV